MPDPLDISMETIREALEAFSQRDSESVPIMFDYPYIMYSTPSDKSSYFFDMYRTMVTGNQFIASLELADYKTPKIRGLEADLYIMDELTPKFDPSKLVLGTEAEIEFELTRDPSKPMMYDYKKG